MMIIIKVEPTGAPDAFNACSADEKPQNFAIYRFGFWCAFGKAAAFVLMWQTSNGYSEGRRRG